MVKSLKEFVLINSKSSLKVKITNLGATITNIIYKDKNNQERDIVLGLDSVIDYHHFNEPYFGSIIGRFANRIQNAQFSLNGQTYNLERNKGSNSLHGGFSGFSRKTWTPINNTSSSLILQLISEHNEGGYPSCLSVTVNYLVTDNDKLIINYQATILDVNDKCLSTIINLTNHTYFNLNGVLESHTPTITNHVIKMNCENFLEVNSESIPTGEILSVKKFPAMDFTEAKEVGKQITQMNGNGFDHYYVLEGDKANYKIEGGILREAVQVFSPLTGIKMKMYTTEPGFQFYTGNHLHGELKNIRNKSKNPNHEYDKHSGLCLEAQRFPNSINVEDWKQQCIIRPKQVYSQKTIFQFELEN